MFTSHREAIAAIGMFDGVHLGHRYLLRLLFQKARESGLKPMVVTFPYHPLENLSPLSAPKLLTPDNLDKKRLVTEACGMETAYLSLAFSSGLRSMTACEFMTWLRKNYGVKELLVGWDHRFGSDRLKSEEDYRLAGEKAEVKVSRGNCYVLSGEDTRGRGELAVSSSAVREALAKGDPELAALLLGRPFSLKGTVVRGNRLGSLMGFPTANINSDKRAFIPAGGVYAVRAYIEGLPPMKAVANIGHRPTVADKLGDSLRVEVHIMEFNGSLYGRELRIDFLKYIRPEIKFGTITQLKNRIILDTLEASRVTD